MAYKNNELIETLIVITLFIGAMIALWNGTVVALLSFSASALFIIAVNSLKIGD